MLELEAFTRKKEIQLVVRSDFHRVRRRHDQVSTFPEQPDTCPKTHSFGTIAPAANDAKAVTVHCVAERFGGGFVNFIGFVRHQWFLKLMPGLIFRKRLATSR
jgi:hypothetical protein